MTSQNSPALSNHHYSRSHFREIYKKCQREEVKWREMTEYLEGGSIPTKKYHKTILEQFTLKDEILYYVKEALMAVYNILWQSLIVYSRKLYHKHMKSLVISDKRKQSRKLRNCFTRVSEESEG